MEEHNTADGGGGGCGIDVQNCVFKKAFIACFPLHEEHHVAALYAKWMDFRKWPWQQPYDDIKDYFGEKVALYFAWLGHYTTWLIFAALAGIVSTADSLAEGYAADVKSLAFFGLFMCLWSTFFLEFWKRQNATLRQKWGMEGFEQHEEARWVIEE